VKNRCVKERRDVSDIFLIFSDLLNKKSSSEIKFEVHIIAIYATDL
jgi:hypothetical protein